MKLIIIIFTLFFVFLEPYSKTNTLKGLAYKQKGIVFKIDSIRIFTGIYIKSNMYTPVYRYQDSLFCNYDTLKQKAISAKQTFTIKQNDSIFNILEGELIKIKEFRITLNDSNKLFSLPKSKFCDIDGEMSDCFELYYNGKSLKIGLKSDYLFSCYLENKYIKIDRKCKFLEHLIYVRNNK